MPTKEDCEMLEMCRQYGNVYGICKSGTLLGIERCSPAQKITLKILMNIDKKLNLMLDKKMDD